MRGVICSAGPKKSTSKRSLRKTSDVTRTARSKPSTAEWVEGFLHCALSGFSLSLGPLRERREDLGLLPRPRAHGRRQRVDAAEFIDPRKRWTVLRSACRIRAEVRPHTKIGESWGCPVHRVMEVERPQNNTLKEPP